MGLLDIDELCTKYSIPSLYRIIAELASSPQKMLIGLQDSIPDMLFKTYLATAGIMQPLLVPAALPATNYTNSGGSHTHPTACGNHFLDGPSNREKCCSQLCTIPGSVLSGTEKKCLCQLYLYTVSRMSPHLSV